MIAEDDISSVHLFYPPESWEFKLKLKPNYTHSPHIKVLNML